ncbi:MAG: UbiD family decarboxylase, partial [Chloroflexi bacterium]|nr:UbiD family decarboxylase [Chloroflexota bacterium]
ELTRVNGAHWDLELGTLTALNAKKANPKALLFDNITGYPEGYRVLTGALMTPGRLSITLGLPYCATTRELLPRLRKRLLECESNVQRFAPRVVKHGLVTENVQKGDQVDLLRFPTPKWSELDGGRYLGTGCALITRDPDTGEINLGTYRVMLHDRNTTALYVSVGKHGRLHYDKYHSRGQPAPVAVTIGQHPIFLAVGGVEIPHEGSSEYHFAGALSNRRVRVIIDDATGLPIPADADIVITGFSPPDKRKSEGPFGEFLGYYGSKDRPEPVVNIQNVYYRKNPIILGAPPNKPPSDCAYMIGALRSAMLFNWLVKSDIRDVKEVWMNEIGQQQFIIISLKQRYAGHAKQAATVAVHTRLAPLGKYCVVVDDDIDPTNLQDVLWAICTRSDPEKNINLITRAWSSPLDTSLRKPPVDGFINSRAIIEAVKPFAWYNEFPQSISVSPELAERVKGKWGKQLGI